MDDGELEEVLHRIPPPDEGARRSAEERWKNLTKPEGSLGRLETLGTRLAEIQGTSRPRIGAKAILVFAADHGVTAEGVSAYPREVTRAMVDNFLNGGAAISALARLVGAELSVIDVGVDSEPLAPRAGFTPAKVARGTRNLAREAAMSSTQTRRAVQVGLVAADRAHQAGATIVGLGDMGIGNTTSASALIAALTGAPAREVVGRGTGINDEAFERKVAVVESAVERGSLRSAEPWRVMEAVGGLEIAGLAGAALGAASHRCPVVIDGLISTAGALWASRIAPAVIPYLIPSHASVERGQRVALHALGLEPYLDLEMRLGEGTGAALQIVLCEAACRLLDGMATFEEAEVARRSMSP